MIDPQRPHVELPKRSSSPVTLQPAGFSSQVSNQGNFGSDFDRRLNDSGLFILNIVSIIKYFLQVIAIGTMGAKEVLVEIADFKEVIVILEIVHVILILH